MWENVIERWFLLIFSIIIHAAECTVAVGRLKSTQVPSTNIVIYIFVRYIVLWHSRIQTFENKNGIYVSLYDNIDRIEKNK